MSGGLPRGRLWGHCWWRIRTQAGPARLWGSLLATADEIDPMVCHGVMHVMVWIQLVVLPACYFLTCLCFHAKLLWMKVWTCVQLAVLENLQFKDASEGGGAAVWLLHNVLQQCNAVWYADLITGGPQTQQGLITANIALHFSVYSLPDSKMLPHKLDSGKHRLTKILAMCSEANYGSFCIAYLLLHGPTLCLLLIMIEVACKG